MQPEIENIVKEDYVKVSSILLDIMLGKRFNGLISKVGYLDPIIKDEETAVDSPHGAYAYFNTIKEALEWAMVKGYIPNDDYSRVLTSAPLEIQQLLAERLDSAFIVNNFIH